MSQFQSLNKKNIEYLKSVSAMPNILDKNRPNYDKYIQDMASRVKTTNSNLSLNNVMSDDASVSRPSRPERNFNAPANAPSPNMPPQGANQNIGPQSLPPPQNNQSKSYTDNFHYNYKGSRSNNVVPYINNAYQNSANSMGQNSVKAVSNKSQPVIDNSNNPFKLPHNSNSNSQVFRSEFSRARTVIKYSNDNLRRIQIKESIINTNLDNSSHLAGKNIYDLHRDFTPIWHYVVDKSHHHKEIILTAIIAGAFIVLCVKFKSQAMDILNNTNFSMSDKGLKNILLGLAIIGIITLFGYLIKKNLDYEKSERKLIADGCVHGIRQSLLEKKQMA